MASSDYGEILGWSRESDGVCCIDEEETTGKLEKNGKNNWYVAKMTDKYILQSQLYIEIKNSG